MFILASANASCQVNSARDFDTLSFINQFIKDKRSHIYLYKEAGPGSIQLLQNTILKGKFVRRLENAGGVDIYDSIVLNEVEIKAFLDQIDTLRSFQWSGQVLSKINLDRLRLIDSDTLTSLSEYLIKYEIVPPLLFRNSEFCFFLYGYDCGSLCGHAELTIYKKEKEGWKRW